MNEHFAAFVASSKTVAEAAGLEWDPPLNCDGRVREGHEWDLSAPVHAPPPRAVLAHLGPDEKVLTVIEARGGAPQLKRDRRALSQGWRDLIQAAAVDQVLVRRNMPLGAVSNVIRPLRVLATCVPSDVEPWSLSREDVERALDPSSEAQRCGKLHDLVLGVVRDVIDRNHLADRSPLAPPSARRRLANHKAASPPPPVKSRLEERTEQRRLPDATALWELVRIVFCERPRTFMDVLRFAQVKLLLLCAFRIGEVDRLPHDWKRTREYFDVHGRPAGESGGLSHALCVRHFAEKKRGLGENSVALYESMHYVPTQFEEVVQSSLSTIERLTAPLRSRLKAQVETGRVFPEYPITALITAVEFFQRFLGTLHMRGTALPEDLEQRYKSDWELDALDAIRISQADSSEPLRNAVKAAWSKLHARSSLPPLRDSLGFAHEASQRQRWQSGYFKVGELEDYVKRTVPTKLPDRSPMRLADGSFVYPHEFLFLAPKRDLLEERNGSLLDVGLYFSVGRVDPLDLSWALGGREEANLFRRYGQTPEDEALALNSHSLRHLQAAELDRLGVSDIMLAKWLNHEGIAENRPYKHPTLAEDLSAMDLPPGAEDVLGPGAQDALRLIEAGRLAGPFVDRFRSIQRSQGEDAALQFLASEADGFQATLYGYCVTSFLVNPCSNEMECFNGCKRLVLSSNEDHTANLLRMRRQYSVLIEEISKLPAGQVGRDNQLASATTRLINIDRALASGPGKKPFPAGEDRFEPFPKEGGLL